MFFQDVPPLAFINHEIQATRRTGNFFDRPLAIFI